MDTTFDKIINSNPKRKKNFDQEYNKFFLSEFALETMESEQKEEIKSIKPENFSVSERMSALESLVGIVHSENSMFTEKYAKEERLAKQ